MGKFFENILDWIMAGGIVVYCIFWGTPKFVTFENIITDFPNIGLCVFGFLIALLGIIVQGDSTSKVLSASKQYAPFIRYNKRVVIISLLLSIYAYLLPLLLKTTNWPVFETISVSLFLGTFVLFVYDVIYFVYVFYLLMQKEKGK